MFPLGTFMSNGPAFEAGPCYEEFFYVALFICSRKAKLAKYCSHFLSDNCPLGNTSLQVFEYQKETLKIEGYIQNDISINFQYI